MLMMIRRNSSRLVLVVPACVLTIILGKPALSGWLDGVKEMKIGEETYPVCPEDEWVRAGLPAREELPDDQNAAIEYVKAINLYLKEPEELRDLYEYVLSNVWIEEAKPLLPWLDQNAPAMEAVREGVKKNDCRFPLLKKPGEPFMNLLLPHLSTMRSLARLLVIHGKRLEYEKKYREAFDAYLVISRMGYHVSKDPVLISGLVGVACDAIAAKAIEGSILRNRLDAETLAYLRERLDVVGRVAGAYRVSISGERVFGLSLVDDLFKRPKEFYAMLGTGQGHAPEVMHVLPAGLGGPLGLRAIMKSDIRRYWNWMDKWNELPDHVALRPENRIDDKVLEEIPAWSVAQMLLPALSRARISFVRSRAVKAILTAEVALEIYRVQNRSYPKSLDQLKGILDEVPIDPFSGEALKYKPTEDGYVVYSVGENLVDDGGEGELTRTDAKDIVGRCPLPEPKVFRLGEER